MTTLESVVSIDVHAEQLGGTRLDRFAKRSFDVAAASVLLVALLPVLICVAIAIKCNSRGTVFYRCTRVGHKGRELQMLKFRKLRRDAQGPALTLARDDRFTSIGRFLAATKLDELPQLWNVLRGEMSLVGPRPEDPQFVTVHPEAFGVILRVRPGITGLSQLAYAREGRILDPHDRVGDYVVRILPQKIALDQMYAARRSLGMDLRILFWTGVAIMLRREVAVHRATGRLNHRRRSRGAEAPEPSRPEHAC